MTETATITRVSERESETIDLGAAFARVLRGGDVVALRGDLGAGKTRFVRGLAAGLGIDPAGVSSPTFILVHEHPPGARGLALVHVDAYRLAGPDDLDTLDWDRLVASGDHVLVIEWAERLGDAIPAERFEVEIRHDGEQRRTLEFRIPPGRRGPPGA